MNPDEITPPNLRDAESSNRDAAANVIRSKLDALYNDEPDAQQEAAEVEAKHGQHLSKHQKFMKQLTAHNDDAAVVQTAWHEYYQGLPAIEKHEVWQEFYSEQAIAKQKKTAAKEHPTNTEPEPAHHYKIPTVAVNTGTKQEPGDIKSQILGHVQTQVRENHHIRSLFFGLSMGCLVLFVFLFSFFNERFIAPFIRPSYNVSATPIIVDPNNSGPVGPEAKIIIPKINVEAPVVYDVESIEEKAVQEGLERGVVHYSTTPNPGEKGNAVIFGHSSSNILNKGKYKFAFLLLKSLETDDTFIIQKDGKRYVYKVYKKFVTNPQDLSVLAPTEREATMTLITCDPPGTSTNRLIIQAEQIFPDPAKNAESSVQQAAVSDPQELPSNSISLWQRLFGRN